MKRALIFDHFDNYVCDLSINDVLTFERREEINGEHSITVSTTQVLEKNQRILYQDERGYWREYVIVGTDEEHASGVRIVGTYYAVWSLQPDLQGVTVSVMPGVQTPTTAGNALTALLSSQTRWAKGTVTNMNTGGASMYDRSAWDAMRVLISVWGGEIDATITVGDNVGVVSRAVDCYSQQGSSSATRRFDFGADIVGVTRTLSDEPYYCRISPRGRGEETDSGGYGRKITIEDVNGGVDWLEYNDMVDVAKIPDGNGGYQYPTLIIENPNCVTPADLKAWAQGVMVGVLTPKVTYRIDVAQSAIAGVDAQGVSLGDAVNVVDRYFGDGLRLNARVVSLTINELNGREISVTLGDVEETLSHKLSTIGNAAIDARDSVDTLSYTLSTVEYIDDLLGRINAEISADGGYTYIIPGNGIRTYDAAVSDPLVGSEASKVVEIKGGSIRIANTRDAGGNWEWKTVFTSGHISADLVTAANITTGYIGSAGGSNYWDLDNGVLTVGAGSIHGGTLTMGGDGNENGIIQVLDAEDSVICKLDKDGANIEGLITVKGAAKDSGFSTVLDSSTITLTDPQGIINGTTTEQTLYGISVRRDYKGTVSSDQRQAERNRMYFIPHAHQTSVPNPVSLDRAAIITKQGLLLVGNVDNINSYEPYTELQTVAKLGLKTSSYHGYFSVNSSSFTWRNDRSSTPDLMTLTAGLTSSTTNLSISGYGSADHWNSTSDKRLKKHIAYLGEKACEFVRKLKPALFEKNGERLLGFYAQDVSEADPWDTKTVREESDSRYEFNPLTLDYDALIAPLVAYCQSLEERITALENRGNE